MYCFFGATVLFWGQERGGPVPHPCALTLGQRSWTFLSIEGRLTDPGFPDYLAQGLLGGTASAWPRSSLAMQNLSTPGPRPRSQNLRFNKNPRDSPALERLGSVRGTDQRMEPVESLSHSFIHSLTRRVGFGKGDRIIN